MLGRPTPIICPMPIGEADPASIEPNGLDESAFPNGLDELPNAELVPVEPFKLEPLLDPESPEAGELEPKAGVSTPMPPDEVDGPIDEPKVDEPMEDPKEDPEDPPKAEIPAEAPVAPLT